jgi:hypothetical protein
MCHVDQNNCAEMIVKDDWVYIVDDYYGSVKMTSKEFENLMKIYKQRK